MCERSARIFASRATVSSSSMASLIFTPAAPAGDKGGDTHAQEVFRHRLTADVLGVRVHIDKARRDDAALRVELHDARSRHVTHRDDVFILHGHTAGDERGTGAVSNAGIS